MALYFVGIDISKYKHDCCILSAADQNVVSKFVFLNNKDGFDLLLHSLRSLGKPEDIRIGFESTSHYALNLELFLEKAHHSFMEVNPVLISEYKKSTTLRRTKTDPIDCEAIARWLMTVEYKPHSTGFYHAYSLKSLTRLRDRLVRQRSLYLVKITNVLDHTFPEFKPFFGNRFSKTALFLLENYGSADKMSRMNSQSYENLRRISRGKFAPKKFLELKALAASTVGESNEMFESQLSSLLSLYKLSVKEIDSLEQQITDLIRQINPHSLSIPGIGPLSAAVIYAEFGDISRFTSPQKMLAFAGLDPGYYQSGISAHSGHMVKRGSSHLRFTLMNLCIPLMQHNVVFAEYYAKKRAEGKPHRVACTHMVKKLIRIIYTLETRGIDFDPEKLR
jgi:transposase